ncbi:MAG: hypothetical protein WCI45_12480 [Desulfuromonadales bacterium]
MPERKSTKRLITEAVLAQLPEQDSTIEEIIFQWWMTGRQDGLRLTQTGDTAFRLAEIEYFNCPADKLPPGSWYNFLVDLNRKMKCPYYLGSTKEEKREPYIRIYDSKIAMMLTIYGNLQEYLESITARKR